MEKSVAVQGVERETGATIKSLEPPKQRRNDTGKPGIEVATVIVLAV